MFIRFWPQLNFFNLDLGLGFAGFPFLFCFLVKELSEVHHPANRGGCIRSNFNEIQFRFTCDLERLVYGEFSQVVTLGVDDVNFT